MKVQPRGSSPPSILIADDHRIFADALKVLLEKQYRVIGVVTDGRALVAEASRLNPDVVIVDVGMPLLNGFEAARRVREQAPAVKIIVLTMHDDPNLAAAVIELGAAGFVLKHSAATELVTAIDHVLSGRAYVTPKLRPDDDVARNARLQQFGKVLTPRQRDVVQMCAEGRPIKEVANRLRLSQKTVEFHKHRVMLSFNLHSNADLVLFALKHRLISVDGGSSETPEGSDKTRPDRPPMAPTRDSPSC